MEAHPVPQNVTSFEFHLVGDMTLKQFGYLAAGLSFAYLVFFIFASPAPYIAWPIIVTSASIGIMFAFLPIRERPLDHWVGAFFKATFRPTQFAYKSAVVVKEDPFFKKRLNFYLSQSTTEQLGKVSWGTTPNISLPVPVPGINPPQPNQPKTNQPPAAKQPSEKQVNFFEKHKLPSAKDLKETVELAKQAQEIQVRIIETEKQLSQIKFQAAEPGADPKRFEKDFRIILDNLQKLNNEASEISRQLANLSKTPPEKITTPATLAKSIPTISLTLVENILNGIITDFQGNYIEGAILVAHDKQGLPVRALKTNKLGQFIAATPLPNGVYTLTCEKDNLIFDTVKVELTNQVLQPVMISAKKGGI